jgi:hypothetical protein
MDEFFWLNTQRIGDAIDVVEVADYLRRIVDNLVIRTGSTEDIEVGWPHDLRGFGQLFGVLEQCAIEFADACLAPIGTNVVDEQISLVIVDNPEIFDLSTEVVRMRAPSVEAVIDGGRDSRQHFALAARQRRRAVHHRTVHVHRGLHDAWVLRHDAHNVPNTTSALDGRLVLLLQVACGFLERKDLDPRHIHLVRMKDCG